LRQYGFEKHKCIVVVSVCRDELTRPFTVALNDVWGSTVNFASLAGSITCGKTGFATAFDHAPQHHGKEKYVIIAAPHIGVAANGEVGIVERDGRKCRRIACGALESFREEMQHGTINLQLDTLDMEQSILKQTLFRDIEYGAVPSLMDLTNIAHDSIAAQINSIVQSMALSPDKCDYAVLTGVQVHGPHHVDMFQHRSMYAVVDGVRVDLVPEFKRCGYHAVTAAQHMAMEAQLNSCERRRAHWWTDRKQPVDATVDGNTALSCAVISGSVLLVECLLHCGVHLVARNSSAQTPSDLTQCSRILPC